MKTTFGNSAFYLYLETVVTLALGYFFWIVVSLLLGVSKTGESSAVITFATILATISTIGIPTGIQRFLGRAKALGDQRTFNVISKFAILFTILAMFVGSIPILLLNDTISHIFKFSQNMTPIIIISSISFALVLSLRGIVVSSSLTRILVKILILGTAIRFATILFSYFYHMGAQGIVLSYAASYLASAILLVHATRRNLFTRTNMSELKNKKDILASSISGWIPNAISIVGTQSGVLFIFGLRGASDAGIYFIAFSIFSALSALPMSIISMAYPIMSGMAQGREKLLWQGTKMALFSVIPLTVVVAVYPSFFLSIFGSDFTAGNIILSLLMLSLIPVEINRAISNLAYAHGKYKQVLILGAIPSVIRIVSYFLLAPLYGSLGTAIAFFIGSAVGLGLALFMSVKSQYQFPSKSITALSFIPAGLGLVLYSFDVNMEFGIPVILLGSYIAFARLRVVRYREIEGTLNSVFMRPNKLSRRVLTIAKTVFC